MIFFFTILRSILHDTVKISIISTSILITDSFSYDFIANDEYQHTVNRYIYIVSPRC